MKLRSGKVINNVYDWIDEEDEEDEFVDNNGKVIKCMKCKSPEVVIKCDPCSARCCSKCCHLYGVTDKNNNRICFPNSNIQVLLRMCNTCKIQHDSDTKYNFLLI